jgi:hypothetical protein
MRSLIAAAAVTTAALATGCYGPMYSQPYSSPGYPVGPPTSYPGPINTQTPGPAYAPGGSYAPNPTFAPSGAGTVPNNGLNSPYYGAPGSNAPTYSPPPGNNSAIRPVPDPRDAGGGFTQPTPAGGGDPLGYLPGGSGVVPTAGESIGRVPRTMPSADAAPIFTMPSADAAQPGFTGEAQAGEELSDTTLQKIALPPASQTYPASATIPTLQAPKVNSRWSSQIVR